MGSDPQNIYCVVHMTYIKLPYLGTFFFSRYPSVALARNKKSLVELVAGIFEPLAV